ncbi:MAG: type II toxin-antitoxin system RelE/ParE family toxin [Saprospiraceae bacterium]|nr:type II toxin-antitoxin system RelE/ParE family toxin [Saprospiraceae bacterium]
METNLTNSFIKSVNKIKDKKLKLLISKIINDVELAKDFEEIQNIVKLTGYKAYYRIRLGKYRIGIEISNDVVTFSAFAHRSMIYKKFP